MVFTPVDPAVKEKIIAAYLSGKGRNQIDRDLHEQGVKVSHGSISNIINAYKHEHEHQPQSPQPEAGSISTGVPMNNIEGSSLLITHSGIGRAVSTTNSSSVTPKNGGPLSHLLVNMTNSPIEPTLSTITNSVTPEELDFSDNPYPESYPNPDLHVDNMQVNIKSDIDDKYVIKDILMT